MNTLRYLPYHFLYCILYFHRDQSWSMCLKVVVVVVLLLVVLVVTY